MKRLTLLLVLLLAAPAQAGTLSVRHDPYEEDWYSFVAAPGERNAITIVRAGRGFRFTDTAGAPTGDCTRESPTTVLCSTPNLELYVSAGDGDDTVLDRSGRMARAWGEQGADRLRTTEAARLDGEAGDDVLEGGKGQDRLNGGPGRDRLGGGRGDDRFELGDEGAKPERDVISGGVGADTVDYYDREEDLRIDLARGRGPEGDVYKSVERAIGSSGDDVLIGNARNNRLEGREGKDRVDGGAGDDSLVGEGKDTLIGRDGDDDFDSVGASDVYCGAGADSVWFDQGSVPRLHGICEQVRSQGPFLRMRAGTVRATWTNSYGKPCRLRVTVNRRPVAARAWVRIRRPATVRITPVKLCDKDILGLPPPGVMRLL